MNRKLSLARSIPKNDLHSDLNARACPKVCCLWSVQAGLRMSQSKFHGSENFECVNRKICAEAQFYALAWNLVDAAVAIGSGAIADSAALIGFGIDASVLAAQTLLNQ